MPDIYCAKCGEPWDAYGVRNGDMTPEDADRFKHGEGCPGCHFGTVCTECRGTGMESTSYGFGRVPVCGECRDNRKLLVREFRRNGVLVCEHGYKPDVKCLTPEQRQNARQIGKKETRHFQDVTAQEFFLLCPHCMADIGKPLPHLLAPPCGRCEGTGQFRRPKEETEANFIRAVESAMDASDEDPLKIINQYGAVVA